MNTFCNCAWVVVLAAVSGCGGTSGPVRHEITGRVTYKGEPVEEGIISFEPMDGQGSKDGATIINGDYRIPKDKGLFVGKYRVSIIIGDGSVGAGNASPDAPQRKRVANPGKERAPPGFNRDSKLVAEVKSGGPNKFDFAIP
jgi:hypothetical protein